MKAKIALLEKRIFTQMAAKKKKENLKALNQGNYCRNLNKPFHPLTHFKGLCTGGMTMDSKVRSPCRAVITGRIAIPRQNFLP